MFFKKKTTQLVYESIKHVVLEKNDKVATNYFLTLEKYSMGNRNIVYENLYLWDYILRDVIVSVLTDYIVYIYTPDKENALSLKEDFKSIYPYYEILDGTIFLTCNKIDYRIVTELIKAYESMWDWDGPIFFAAYYGKKADFDFKKLDSYEQLKDYALRIESARDKMGIEITIDPEQISESELIERIRSVVEKYRIELKVI